MSHKPNLLSWDQDVAALRHHFVSFTKPITTARTLPPISHLTVLFFSSYQVFETFIPPKIIVNYSFLFFKCFVIRARQKKFPDLQKIIIFCKNNERKKYPHFENHWCMKWRHTGSDQSTNVYPRDAPSLLAYTFKISRYAPGLMCSSTNQSRAYNSCQKCWDSSRQMTSHAASPKTRAAHSSPLRLSMLVKKNNNNNNNLDNSFWTPSFQELFAFKNSILQLKWR